MSSNTCRSCGAEIKWVTLHKTGKSHPINPTEVIESQKGTFVVQWPDGAFSILSNLGDFDPYKKYYTSHFATCPQADKWRKKS